MHWLGAPYTDRVIICYRATESVVCYATVGDKRSESVSADTSVDDGIVRLEITGLEPDTEYNYQIFQDGTQVASGTVNTIGHSGYAIAYMSCWQINNAPTWWVYETIRDYEERFGVPVRVVIFQGDTPYIDIPLNGETFTIGEVEYRGLANYIADELIAPGAVADFDYSDENNKADILAQYHKGNRAFRSWAMVKAIIERWPTLWQADDHEYVGNDLNYDDFETSNDSETVVANQTQHRALMDICREGYRAWRKGNPPNSDANNDSNFDDDDQTYWRLPLPLSVEIFATDNIYYANSESNNGTNAKKMVGDTQKAWLTGQVASSSATFKIWSTTGTLSGVWGAAALMRDAHPQTATAEHDGERDEIIKSLAATPTVFAISGDTHHSTISVHNGVHCFCSCPVASTRAEFSGYSDGRIWLYPHIDLSSGIEIRGSCIGFVEVRPGAVVHRIINDLGREPVQSRTFISGTNTPNTPTNAAAAE